jgi:pyruvate/2-oxoglutarate dehydrogenase complex dihydrolipoamide acyltransferase (E2) component
MAVRVVMPQAGQDLETGTITSWLKAEGDTVARGEPIVSIETEKISVDVEAPAAGTLLRILAPNGAEVPILATIAVIGAPGEDVSGIS